MDSLYDYFMLDDDDIALLSDGLSSRTSGVSRCDSCCRPLNSGSSRCADCAPDVSLEQIVTAMALSAAPLEVEGVPVHTEKYSKEFWASRNEPPSK